MARVREQARLPGVLRQVSDKRTSRALKICYPAVAHISIL